MNKNNPTQSGVALLMSLGILALLSILGVAFSTNMRLMERTTRDFVYDMQARYLAEGGVEYAVASLKADARTKFLFTKNSIATNNQINLAIGNDTVVIDVKDTATKINVNYADKNLLDTVLAGVGQNKAQDIIDQRNGPDGKPGIANFDDDGNGVTDEADELGASSSDDIPFITPKSINSVNKIGDVFTANKDFITAWGYCDPNTQDNTGNNVPRSAININTASQDVLKKILEPIDQVSLTDAATLASQIVSRVTGGVPFNSWEGFNDFIDTQDYLDATAKQNVKDNFNPNRRKPQCDSNTASTEFCFHSGGTYELTATGTVTKGSGGTSQIVAQKTINTIVEIFNLWNQTTKEQFVISGSGSYKGVTWEDSCPVRSDDNWNCGIPKEEDDYDDASHSTNYLIIKNALKIGYWDEFNENKSNIWWNKQENPTQFNGVADMPVWGTIILGNGQDDWKLENYSATIMALEQYTSEPNTGIWDYDGVSPDENTAHRVGNFIYALPDGDEGRDDLSCAQWYIKTEKKPGVTVVHTPALAPFVYSVYTAIPEINNEWVEGTAEIEYSKSLAYRITKIGRDVNFHMIKDMDTTKFGGIPSVSATRRVDTNGWIKMWSGTEDGTHWDNLRVIPDHGSYTSDPLTLSSAVEWGTVWGTVTRPDSVKNIMDVDIKIEVPPADGTETEMDFTGGAQITAQNSTGIQYQANLYSIYDATNNPYLETPVLEDVWITYMPKTKILYWREGVEEDEAGE